MRPSAADLLSLMSFFDRQGVSENLLRVQGETQNDDSTSEITSKYDDNTNSTSELDTDHDFENDITTLRDFSFISHNKDDIVFTMHWLVQLTVRVWLKADEQLERWKEQFITILYESFPTGEYENWAQCQSLFPYIKSAISQRPESHESLRKWATLLYMGVWYTQECGYFAESRDMASKSRKQRALLFGSEGEQTIDSTTMLAHIHRLEGHWEKAEQLFVRPVTRMISLVKC